MFTAKKYNTLRYFSLISEAKAMRLDRQIDRFPSDDCAHHLKL